jgi:hypothetical protein
MKRLFIIIAILLFSSTAYAQVLTLNSPESLAVPTASKLDLKEIRIDIGSKSLMVMYQFMNDDGTLIPMQGSSQTLRNWMCVDRAAQLESQCTGVGEPYRGCTGVGTGTNLDPGSTCFTDTFSFAIRAQDVGVAIGKGLRALIWNKMRPNVLTGTNNATLP